MKNYKKILTGLTSVLLLSACNDLDTIYYGDEVTTGQKEGVLEVNPEMAQASVNAIASGAYDYMTILSGHNDFGVPSIMMMLDSNGQDFVSANLGYNWMRASVALTCGTYTSDETYEIWYTMYNQILAANNVIATIPGDTEDETSMFYRAQALCFRAFDYWLLSQVYQQNIQYTSADAPTVPLLTEENQEEAAMNGAPRAPISELYAQIISDLQEAVSLLSNTSVTAQKVMSVKPKRFFNLDAAYGTLARVYLTMGDYQNALSAAQNCLSVTSCTPYTIQDVNHPTFISLDDKSWLWGQAVAETDGCVLSGIVNFPSMMGTFSYGYSQYGAWRWCNEKLYNYIPATDVRKGWWLNENYESPNLNEAYYAYLDSYDYTNDANNGGTKVQVYTQVKYAPYNYEIDTSTNAADIPYFRIEEVYYILYEAMAMTGNTGGAVSGLVDFVKTYRNPSYNFSASSASAIQEEIWMQRRVEFWGEGFVSWFDLKRLNKDLDRRGGHYPTSYTYFIPAGSQEFVLPIPQQETTTNKQLTQSENNPQWPQPSPVQN